jgi:hypothetical protein
VIGETGGELELLINDNPEIGWFCDCHDRLMISKKIDEISELDFSKLEGASKGVIENLYSYQAACDRYVRTIEEMIN